MKIAIVGSEEKHWTPQQRGEVVHKIRRIFRDHIPEAPWLDKRELVSGGCPYGGVDLWAEIVADVFGIPKKIFYPEKNQKEFYRKRNQQIADYCDVLYCFDPKKRDWSGGQWTMKMAKELGKEVHFIQIE